MNGDVDAVVIGGGPAGAAAAAWLAEAGRRVVLFEREAVPHHKVCGEFVSVEAAEQLETLGLDPAALGALPIGRVRLIAGGREASAPLPFPAFSLSRKVLDEALLRAAGERGAVVQRGTLVRTLDRVDGGVVAVPADGPPLRAAAGFLAIGKHELKAWRRIGGRDNGRIGFKLHVALAPEQARALGDAVEMILFPGGYAGLQPLADGRANLCLLVEKETFRRLGRHWPALLAHMADSSPIFAERIAGMRPQWDKPLAIHGIPYGFVHRSRGDDGPLYRLGDQLAVIPSFCGDGMAIALHSARRAAEHWLEGRREPFDGRPYGAQIGRAMLLSRAIGWSGLHSGLVGLCRIAPGLLRGAATGTRVDQLTGA
ncbi:NAD(P)/FAD-dependent oxidoreductase [Azospirillum soli]|uniref:NAD(P)/FAD-dependent oxidoreductase n=1 Tax=Azospirillum soli TaxID=1304799 RepID=UPI001AE53251|nr:flavin-dependent dehydrogenase [Azospirillum soli]